MSIDEHEVDKQREGYLEENDVAIKHQVVLALLPVLAGSLDGTFIAMLLEVGIRHDFGADETVHEIRVDDSGSLGRLRALLLRCTDAHIVTKMRIALVEQGEAIDVP